MLVRIVRRLAGRPRLRMKLAPAENYGERARPSIAGSHHIRYSGRDHDWRLTTNASIAMIREQRVFVLEGKNKPAYSPTLDCGDHVVVVNAAEARDWHWPAAR